MEPHIQEHPFSRDPVQSHMTTHFCTGAPTDTVSEYLEKLKQCQSPVESLTEVYVTDHNRHLLGVVSLATLLKTDSSKKLGELMRKEFISVHPTTDRERAARLAIHNELDMLPVLDHENHLLGVLSTQSILRILHEESVEDLLRAAGYRRSHKGTFIDVLHARISGLIKVRTPWLLLGLIGGMLAAWVVSGFEGILQKNVILAFFMPVIVYMAAAVGIQTEAFYLRVYDTSGFYVFRYLLRELQVALGIAFLSAILIFLYTLLVFQDISIATVVAVAMLVTILVAVIVATLIPTILVKFNRDPAVGSGPFATMIQDFLSLIIYFVIAMILI